MDTEEPGDFQPEKEKIAIYSKWAILGFSIFFSPLVGSILLMLNLRRTGNRSAGYLVLFFGLIYIIIDKIAALKLAGVDIANMTQQKLVSNNRMVYYSIAFDILGGAILTEYFFKKYLKSDNYTSRSIFPPLLIIIAIFFLLGSLV